MFIPLIGIVRCCQKDKHSTDTIDNTHNRRSQIPQTFLKFHIEHLGNRMETINQDHVENRPQHDNLDNRLNQFDDGSQTKQFAKPFNDIDSLQFEFNRFKRKIELCLSTTRHNIDQQ